MLVYNLFTDAIQCYECTSSYKDVGGFCDDPIDVTKANLVDCEKYYFQTYNVRQNFTMCRKVHQNGKIFISNLFYYGSHH